jgi:hypothetical protein
LLRRRRRLDILGVFVRADKDLVVSLNLLFLQYLLLRNLGRWSDFRSLSVEKDFGLLEVTSGI